jgi:hypothetical protein
MISAACRSATASASGRSHLYAALRAVASTASRSLAALVFPRHGDPAAVLELRDDAETDVSSTQIAVQMLAVRQGQACGAHR